MRRFGSERMDGMLQRLGLKEGEAIIHPWINKALEKAQQKVEAYNFEIRKQLLKFDDVMNDQRKVVYEQRRELIEAARRRRHGARHAPPDRSRTWSPRYMPEKAYPEQWDIERPACATPARTLKLDLPLADWAKEEGIADQEIRDRLLKASDDLMAGKVAQLRRADACAWPRRACCCRSSTICGRSTCSISTICARASTCAATPSATRSTSTSARLSTCSRRC